MATTRLKPGKLSAVRSVLRNRRFAAYTCCNSISMVGMWAQRLAVGWLTWQLTESESWIGAIAFADLLPIVLIGPLAGVWVDRPLRKLMMRWCQSLMLVQVLVLFTLSLSDLISIWLLFLLVLFNGIVAAIYHPVRLSVVPSLVKSDDLMAAVSMTAVSFNLARFAGPALAGLVIAFYGVTATFLVVALCYTVMLFAAFLINIPSRPWLAEQQTRSVWSELRDGLEYAATNRAIAFILLIQAILALCVRPLGELLPAFIGAIFSEGAGMLAVMTSAMGVGAIVAGLRLLLWDVGRGLANLIILSTALSAVAVILFSLTPTIWLAVVIIFFVAYWVAVCGIASQTLIQSRVDETKRGRVISLWAAIYRGVPGVGALIIGTLASRFGLTWPSVIAASLCAIAAAWMYTKRSVMDLDAA